MCQLSSFAELPCGCCCLLNIFADEAGLPEYVATHSLPTGYLRPCKLDTEKVPVGEGRVLLCLGSGKVFIISLRLPFLNFRVDRNSKSPCDKTICNEKIMGKFTEPIKDLQSHLFLNGIYNYSQIRFLRH